MFLAEANSWSVVKKLYVYKLRALIGMFSTLVFVQLLAFAFSVGGSGRSITYSGNSSVTVQLYSGLTIFVFTLMWAFFIGISVTAKHHRDAEFSFVTNRLTSNVSNIAFLLTACLIGGITAPLLGYVLRFAVYWTTDKEFVLNSAAQSPLEPLIGMIVTFLYAGLLASIGYTAGMLVQRNRLFIVLLPGLSIGLLILGARQGVLLPAIVDFYFNEPSLAVLGVKIIITQFILYMLSILISNRLEVRQ